MAFLEQNRSEKLVQERAMTLLDDLLVQYPDRVKRKDSKNSIRIIVSGQSSDWLLVGSKDNLENTKIGIQAVSTQMLSETIIDAKDAMKWSSTICINTGGKNPSLGDQFASRILSLLNDNMTMKRVSTLGSAVMSVKPRLVMSEMDKVSIPLAGKQKRDPFDGRFELKYNGEEHAMLRMPISTE
jgi:hypothetical protein